MRVEDLRSLPLFDGLGDDQLADLLASGSEQPVVPGEDLFREGDPADSWWVLVDGSLDLVRKVGRQETVVARMDVPGRWAGGFLAWDAQGSYLATARGVVPGRVLRVPSEALRARADAWFPFAGHLIDGLYHTARSIESTARQHGSLVTLGTLAAGLAHEINNPAAAASRSVDALGGANDALLASLASLADLGIHAAEFAALDELRREARPVTDDHDALALADREQELAVWMERHDVARAWELAPTLAVAGVDTAWCERAALVLPGPALGAGLAWAAATFAVATLLAEVKESTRRISELVAAVRSYSQVDRATVQQVDLTEGIESTLVVLGHKLRGGVTVRREYAEDLPRIDAYPGELNQVWTNLVDNAVDAMDGEGTLTIVARGEGDHVVVEVHDTGTGMTDEVKARVFEAFFTTKEVGRGTGLGLDIARRIVVERHHGVIDIDTRPGATVVRVRLPVRMAGPAGRAAEAAP